MNKTETKYEPGLGGYLWELSVLEGALLSLEEELQEREARRQGQDPEGVYRKLNEKFMRGLSSEYDRKKAKAFYLADLIGTITGEKKPEGKESRGVTDEQIERARQYPLDSLIESKRGMARCISGQHEDKTASMQVTGNFAYCHSCGYKGDTISVYQTLHGADFVTAVRALS